MQMYAYYLEKGHTLDSLLSLSRLEKIMYIEAMEYAIEMDEEKFQKRFGK